MIHHVVAMEEKRDKITGQKYFVAGNRVYLPNHNDPRPSRQYLLKNQTRVKEERQETLCFVAQ